MTATIRASQIRIRTRPAGLSLAVVGFLVAVGLAIVSATDALSRATLHPPSSLLWLGTAVICIPVTFRLTRADINTAERLFLVVLLGLAIYAVKVMRDPSLFTLTDEFSHVYGTMQALADHHLYNNNALLPVTKSYPGLEGATTAIAQLTGMSPFGAGIVLIGAARMVLMVALFSLFVGVGGSERAAGIGTAVYAADPHFLMWDVQFAYESLAFPLLVLLFACVAQRNTPDTGKWRACAAASALLILAIIPTHHVTSFVMAITLCLISLRRPLLKPDRRTAPLALMGLLLTVLWLVAVASITVGYLEPNIRAAVGSAFKVVTGSASTYSPFTAGAVGPQNTPLDRWLGVVAIVGVLVVIAASLRPAWKSGRRDSLHLLLLAAAIGFLPATALRAIPNGWELSSRITDYLFVGVAFVVGWAPIDRFRSPRLRRVAAGLLSVALGVMVVGGAVDGLDPTSRESLPVVIKADGARIESPSMNLGNWFATMPPGLVVAPDADASFAALLGGKKVASGFDLNADAALSSRTLWGWILKYWRQHGVRYIVADLRGTADSLPGGAFFDLTDKVGYRSTYLRKSAATKFDAAGLTRVYDSGQIYVYELPK